jgi:Sec-independent protein translocase protein TatA
MEIFGIGGAELIAILIIMLVVAGPKRMIQWAYILGKYTAKVRAMWAETMTYVQKEFDEAGVNIQLPKDVPTRGSLNREIGKQVEKVMAPIANPLKTTLDETAAEIKQIKTGATITNTNGVKKSADAAQSPANGKSDLGTWSVGDKKDEQ